jgi:radical SAM superfamily enzyme YgiQ (UPF0313 family)
MEYVAGADGAFRAVDLTRLKTLSFEIGPLRPPSEGDRFSLLLRVTRNCPWNRCTFCYGRFYDRGPFEVRSVPDLKAGIDSMKAIADDMSALSHRLGYAGRIEPLAPMLSSRVLYGKEARGLDKREFQNLYCLITVFNWSVSGGENAFLQDADTPFMQSDRLIEVIAYLKETFPSLKKITSFARSKSLVGKTSTELTNLRQAGIIRLYVGLETGDEELLKLVDKGVTPEEHIQAGKKAIQAGFELSECIMPGLGGRSMWVHHAKNTAKVLNEIDPQFIGLSPFVPVDRTPLLEAYRRGELYLTSPHERLQEIRLMIENLLVTSRVCFTHPFNASYRSGGTLVPLMKQDFGGYRFPEEKELVLTLIDKGLQLDEHLFFDVREMAGIDHL